MSAKTIGRLMKGLKIGIQGTDTMKFIQKHEVPYNKKVTYALFVFDYIPQKSEKERTIITVGGDRLDYQGEVSTKTAGLTTIKLLLNSVISSIWAKFMTTDVKNFYLNTPMEEPEYMKIPFRLIPNEINVDHKVSKFEHAGYLYVQINKVVYGLGQAGLLANELVAKRLTKHGFSQTPHTPGLWKHHTKPIQFALVVDDFGIKYENKQDAQDLINALERNYEAVSVDWDG